jgi:hypothetical protein
MITISIKTAYIMDKRKEKRIGKYYSKIMGTLKNFSPPQTKNDIKKPAKGHSER